MFRRRHRPEREIAFSFDSFLDLVTNVVGIILRLILVAWVGARAYKGPPLPPPPTMAEVEEVAELPDPRDPLAAELERQRRELAETQARLLEQVQAWHKVKQDRELTAAELAALHERQERLTADGARLETIAAEGGRGTRALSLSLADLQARGKQLTEEIEALRRAPSPKRTLRYRTPVSRPLQSEELLFECRAGRVAFIDIGAMVEEARATLREKSELLRTQYEVSDVTAPVGPFRLRYHVERERDTLEGSIATRQNSFRYGLTGWEVEPLDRERGEPAEPALASGSAFRKVIDTIDPQQTAVTLCVYPDSFPAYRRLRDYLHEREIVVAARPLPEGRPIAAARNGSISRGQ